MATYEYTGAEKPGFPETSTSLVKKYLTDDVWKKLQDQKDAHGCSFRRCINSGVKNPDSSIGVYAGSTDSYVKFSALFDPVIQDYHGYGPDAQHVSSLNLADLKDMVNLDPKSEFIISTRIRVGRNLEEFPLGTCITKEDRDKIESQVVASLNGLTGSLAGKYYSLKTMTKEEQTQLIEDHFLFKEGDRFLEACGLNRDWPDGRGIFHNHDKTFLVWLNEEDQLRIISMRKGGDIKGVFELLADALGQIEAKNKFAHTKHHGYITSCPTNLGTAMRASVHIKLPKLGKKMDDFKKIADAHHVQIRGIHGEHSESEGGIFDISNKRRLGISETQCVLDMYKGIDAMLKAEKAL